jgi:alkaline phosphatase D
MPRFLPRASRFVLMVTILVSWGWATEVTHGPILGHVTSDSIRIWGRTAQPGAFVVEFIAVEGPPDWSVAQTTEPVSTALADDNTGWTKLGGLKSDTHYHYRIRAVGGTIQTGGTFRTLPAPTDYANPEHNPKGLFNYRFEYGSCASQNPANGIGPSLPAYTTMLRELKGDILFAVMNGDWLYEEARDYSVAAWQSAQGVADTDIPANVNFAPTVVGVWENYKIYLARAANLAEWHRNVPSYFTFDDHELLNDIWGAGTPGHRDRRAVFRDIGTLAWYDYLGWADPVEFTQDVSFGHAQLEAGSGILHDAAAHFERIDWDETANLHVHWGTATAGVDDPVYDVDTEGDPNAKVYEVLEVIDDQTLRISPAAVANGKVSYSVGRRSYSKFTVGNADYFLLDTKTHREYHDITEADKPGLSILGNDQREWLKAEMAASEADFFFIFSSVPFMVPHRGAGGYAMADNKDESWTVFVDEREKLINFWDELGKPVFVLTGDLHNSFAIKITDHIWEFCSGPHNSVNHRLSDEGDRPKSGLWQFDKREMDIRWSTFILDDIPRPERMHPHYCVVQINNVFNNPLKLGEERWVAYEHPQVIFQFFDGRTGALSYSETISTKR